MLLVHWHKGSTHWRDAKQWRQKLLCQDWRQRTARFLLKTTQPAATGFSKQPGQQRLTNDIQVEQLHESVQVYVARLGMDVRWMCMHMACEWMWMHVAFCFYLLTVLQQIETPLHCWQWGWWHRQPRKQLQYSAPSSWWLRGERTALEKAIMRGLSMYPCRFYFYSVVSKCDPQSQVTYFSCSHWLIIQQQQQQQKRKWNMCESQLRALFQALISDQKYSNYPHLLDRTITDATWRNDFMDTIRLRIETG